MDWETIKKHYNEAYNSLYCFRRSENWHCDDDGEYNLIVAYHEAKNAEVKEHLWYARILSLMASVKRYTVSDYDLFHCYVQPAYNEYLLAKASLEQPTEDEFWQAERDYEQLNYTVEHTDDMNDEAREEAYALLRSKKLPKKFGFHDGRVLSFAQNGAKAEIVIQNDGYIVTIAFDKIYAINVDVDPVVDYISQFYCYRAQHDSEIIIFDIGLYSIMAKSVTVKQVASER